MLIALVPVPFPASPAKCCPQSEVFQTVLYDGNSYRNFGPYNTKAELYAALEQYTNDQTKSGNMTEVEANSILDKYR